MNTPLLARAVLDGQDAIMQAADRVPAEHRDGAPAGLSSGAWLLTHAAETHQVWVGAYVGRRERDPWLQAHRDGVDAPSFAEAREAAEKAFLEATPILESLNDDELSQTAKTKPGSFLEGATVGQILARAIAHLYVHADAKTPRDVALRHPVRVRPPGLPGGI